MFFISRFVFVLGLAATLAAPAFAADQMAPDAGSPGPFKYTCPEGNYLVGLSGRVSNYLNGLGAICAPWANGQQGNQIVGTHFGTSLDGKPTSAFCKANEAVSALEADLPYIRLTCSSLAAPNKVDPIRPELGSANGPGAQSAGGGCPAGQLGVGISGRSGRGVDALSLVCGLAPK